MLKDLDATRRIISGLIPLAILAGGIFVPNDLDIYVPASEEDTLMELIKLHLDASPPQLPLDPATRKISP
jgi:hypothetical protein